MLMMLLHLRACQYKLRNDKAMLWFLWYPTHIYMQTKWRQQCCWRVLLPCNTRRCNGGIETTTVKDSSEDIVLFVHTRGRTAGTNQQCHHTPLAPISDRQQEQEHLQDCEPGAAKGKGIRGTIARLFRNRGSQPAREQRHHWHHCRTRSKDRSPLASWFNTRNLIQGWVKVSLHKAL